MGVCCISKDREKQSLYNEHRKQHIIGFFHGSVPVLAAATIARAVSQFLTACIGDGDISYQIVVYFIYSMFIAHVIGYLVALYVPKDIELFEYYFSLATDNASFAWNSTLTLAIINWLYNEKSLLIALSAWLCLVALVCGTIYFSNFVQDKVIKPSKETKFVLRNFESEAFALAISYSFTVVIAASLYRNESTNYLSNTDDINPVIDDAIDHSLDWVFFAYVVLISWVLVAVQKKVDRRLDKKLSQFRESIDGGPHCSPTLTSTVTSPLSSTSNALHTHHEAASVTATTSSDKYDNSDGLAAPSNWPARADSLWERLSAVVFWWDDDKSTIQSLRCLLATTGGYLVGCGWHVWGVLTFQAYFRFSHGDIVGTLIFALVMTVSVILIMTRITAREEVKVRASLGDQLAATSELEEDGIRHGTAGRGDLIFIFGRLSVGWAWQEFISTAASAVISSDNVDRKWLLVLVDVLMAVLVCWLCGKATLHFKHPAAGADAQHGSSRAGNNSTSSLEAPLL